MIRTNPWCGSHIWTGQLGYARDIPVSGRSKFFKPTFRVPLPRYVHALSDIRVSSVACGANYTIVVSQEAGKVFGFGDNSFGQLGFAPQDNNESEHISELPHEIVGLSGKGIQKVACGEEHCAAVDGNGALFTWGRCSEGQLGHGALAPDLKYCPKPTQVDNLPPIDNVFCGGFHTFALELQSKRARSTVETNKIKARKRVKA